jgi:hypothetical protein
VYVTRRILVHSHRRFGATCRNHLRGQAAVLDCLTVADGHLGVRGTVLASWFVGAVFGCGPNVRPETVKVTPEQATKSQRGSKCSLWRYSFYTTAIYGVGGQRDAPTGLPLAKISGTLCTGGWVGPRGGLIGCGQFRPPPPPSIGIRSSDRPTRSESLYLLSYSGLFAPLPSSWNVYEYIGFGVSWCGVEGCALYMSACFWT